MQKLLQLTDETFYVYWLYYWDSENIYKSGYVGITNDVVNRFYKHRKKYGNFKFKIIFTGSLAQAYALEFLLRPYPNIGMNKAAGGLQFGVNGPMLGRNHTKDAKEKIRLSNLGQKRSQETCKKLKARVRTNEWRRNASIAQIGKQRSEVVKDKISDALRKRIRTDETNDKIRKSVTEIWRKRKEFTLNGNQMALVDAEAPTK